LFGFLLWLFWQALYLPKFLLPSFTINNKSLKSIFTLIFISLGTFTLWGQNKVIDSLQRVLVSQKGDTLELTTRLNLANEYLRRDLPKAKEIAFELIALTDIHGKAKWLGAGYGYLVTIYQQIGKSDSARYYLSLAAQLAKRYPDNIRIQFNYNQSAGFFYKETGELKKALPHMLANIALWKKQDENRAGQFLNVGNLYFRMGDYKKAAESHLQALTLFETLQNKRGQSFCVHGLGVDFFRLKQFDQAKIYFEKSIAIKQSLNDKRGLVVTQTSLGQVHDQAKEYARAEDLFRAALAGAREMNLVLEHANANFYLGVLYKHTNDLSKAKSYLNTALVVAKPLGDSSFLATINSEIIGLRLAEQQLMENANRDESTLVKNLDTQIRTGDLDGQTVGYAQLSAFYAQNKKYEKAFQYLVLHKKLEDSLRGERVILQIQELEKKYQTDKRDQEIVLLKKDQELKALELSRQRANSIISILVFVSLVTIGFLLINRYRIMNRTKRLLEIEKMRNNIARDLHDDIGSTLSSINILSQVALAEQSANPQNYLQRIGDQSKRMMEDMGDMVWSINPRNDSMEQVVVKMREFATETFDLKNIEYGFSEEIAKGLKLNTEQRKNLFLIYKEALNNAAKYSGAKKVEISLQQQGHALMMRIRDNGQGFDEQTIKPGNGLRNMRERATEINGQLSLKSTSGQGTTVQLDLPIA
jgi:two-component system, NarL family, sensor histidine kinase UhpB